jgi:HAD superfamily hydrolase (TIGR01509 family)
MVEAVIFDMDGVIIDSEPVYRKIEQILFKAEGLNISQEEHETFVGTKTLEMWLLLEKKYGLIRTAQETADEEGQRYAQWLNSEEGLEPIPGIKELLKKLTESGVKLAVASSSSKLEIETILTKFGIINYFTALVSGYQVSQGKPSPDIFIYTAGRLDVHPENCIVIEDSRNGINAAKQSGMRCIGFKSSTSGSQDMSSADVVVESIYGISLEMLNSLSGK